MMTDRRAPLDLLGLKSASTEFAEALSAQPIPDLFGVTDGKAIGTFVESAFHDFVSARFVYDRGSAARGVDFPNQNVDLKVTSIERPQSSSPFRSAEQKVYGLDHHLLVFIYEKTDDQSLGAALLHIHHVFFVDSALTADYQTTRGLRELLERDANLDDLTAFLSERKIPLDDMGVEQLARRILENPPVQGYLTISNALQWRLQYRRLISITDGEPGPDGIDTLR